MKGMPRSLSFTRALLLTAKQCMQIWKGPKSLCQNSFYVSNFEEECQKTHIQWVNCPSSMYNTWITNWLITPRKKSICRL